VGYFGGHCDKQNCEVSFPLSPNTLLRQDKNINIRTQTVQRVSKYTSAKNVRSTSFSSSHRSFQQCMSESRLNAKKANAAPALAQQLTYYQESDSEPSILRTLMFHSQASRNSAFTSRLLTLLDAVTMATELFPMQVTSEVTWRATPSNVAATAPV